MVPVDPACCEVAAEFAGPGHPPAVEGRTGLESDGAIPLNFGVCSVYLAGAGQAFTSLRRWIFGASGAILGA